MRLFPDGSIRPADAEGDNTLHIGKPDGSSTILSWQLDKDDRPDQELIVTWEFISHGYLKALNAATAFGILLESHMGFMLRSVISDLPDGKYKGSGPIFGRVWRPENNLPEKIPAYVTSPGLASFRLEEWGNGIVPYPQFEYLRAHSEVAAEDEKRYRMFASSKRYMGELYSRYTAAVLNQATSQYDLLIDTGDVQSNNWGINRYNEALTIFDIGGASKTSDYSIEIINLNCFQQAATCRIPDMRRLT